MSADVNAEAIGRLLDLEDIKRTIGLYVVSIDTRDLSLFDEIFTPDAPIILGGMPPMTPESYKKIGADGLAALDATQHHLGLPVIDLDGDRANARCYFMAQHVRNDLKPANPFLLIGGWYTDELARTEDGWRITKRIGTALWYDGNPDVLGMGDFPMGATPRGDGHTLPAWLKG
ncbi:MAG TPA: nuclear transport factor 2 family protein [Alphaproteobacteria bacterium]|nr:nuclear transport factor 2 family protein [Alphaproteobacteria bacterium]